jgi:hypothetical protein
VGIDPKSCGKLQEAKSLADDFVDGDHHVFDRLRLAGSMLGVPDHLVTPLLQRWDAYGRQTLRQYAPYAAHVVNVELFFHIALGANLISTVDVNNRTDIAYLHYLPFAMMFVSSDRLHERCASLFLREDQIFVWGEDLKADLKRLNEELLQLPEEEREKGLFKTAPRPPEKGLVRDLWDRAFEKQKTGVASWSAPEKTRESSASRGKLTAADFRKFTDARPLKNHEINFDLQDPSVLGHAKNIHVRKGSHWQLPKGTTQK